MIQFDHVSKVYSGGHMALQKVSFQLRSGEMAFLTGHSGAGKSTLLKLISIQERPSDGRILFNRRDLSGITKAEVPFIRRQIGMIFQDHRLLLDRSVFDNVALPLQIAGASPLEIQKRVMAALDKVRLHNKAQHLPMMLSGGEQQRVGIARAIVNMPPLLLADEPTGNLDAALAHEIMQLFRELNALGVAVLIASHDQKLIEESGQRKLVLQQGRLVEDTLRAEHGA
ncbi:MAG: cell division ATP-binding protein FtsE [Gammaproteobacteria bacterium]|nr:cell division ATP-binding protein FtsE [Gammaproteobacteria bacterium]